MPLDTVFDDMFPTIRLLYHNVLSGPSYHQICKFGILNGDEPTDKSLILLCILLLYTI